MARVKDEEKRLAILAEAKRLFAAQGFEATSMGSLARSVGIPVGSLYTYFPSKDELLDTIVEEGWGDFTDRLERGMGEIDASGGGSPRGNALLKISYLVKAALPALFNDIDLISILLSRAGKDSRLEEKLEYLARSISSILKEFDTGSAGGAKLDFNNLRTGLAVMLTGSLEVLRLSFHQGLDMSLDDVVAFLTSVVQDSLGCELPEPGALPS